MIGDVRCLRKLVAEQECRIRDLTCQLGEATERARLSSEWRRSVDDQLRHCRLLLVKVQANGCMLADGHERMKVELMATLADMKDALKKQNDAILAEVKEINDAMAELKKHPTAAELDEIVAGIEANTAEVSNIVATPLPEPGPPPPPPAPPMP
jgi:hypothetical protein